MKRALLIVIMLVALPALAFAQDAVATVNGDAHAVANLRGDDVAVGESTAVATVDGHAIPLKTFDRTYKGYLAHTGARDNARLRAAVVEQLVNDRLLVMDGRRRALDDSAEYERYVDSARRKLLVERFVAVNVLDTVAVTDADVEEAFVRINTEIDARHLFARTIDEARILRNRLEAGETFEDLAKEVFIDTTLANSGGAIGTFTFDELDPDFEDAAFALAVGEISEPVRTAQGYSIIQVLDRFTKPILTELEFAKRKEKLRAFVRSKEQVQARSHYVRREEDRLNAAFEDGFYRLFGQLTGVSLVSEEAMDEFLSRPLISFDTAEGRATWTVGDFRREAAFTHPDQRAQVRTEADLQDFITALVIRSQMLRAAEAQRLNDHPNFEEALAEAADQWVLDRQKEWLVARVSVPEDSIRAHYERYRTEFLTESGERMAYETARSRIAEQLHRLYTRTNTLEYVASLRRAADIHVDKDAVQRVSVAGGERDTTSRTRPSRADSRREDESASASKVYDDARSKN